jgi:hypothetical protein
LIDLFEEIKVFLKHDGEPSSLTKIYYLFDQIWKVTVLSPLFMWLSADTAFLMCAQQQEELRLRNDWVASLLSRALQYAPPSPMAQSSGACTLTCLFPPRTIVHRHRYQRFMMLDFEKPKIIHDYRTPSTLRGYAFVFLSIFPILFGPAVHLPYLFAALTL